MEPSPRIGSRLLLRSTNQLTPDNLRHNLGSMTLSIKSPRADELARELAGITGESITDAVITSLERRLEVERRRKRGRDLDDLVERFGDLPDPDDRTPDEILGYDENGI